MSYKYVLVNYWISADSRGTETVRTDYTDYSDRADSGILRLLKQTAEHHQTHKPTAHLWSDEYVVLVYDLDFSFTSAIERINLDL